MYRIIQISKKLQTISKTSVFILNKLVLKQILCNIGVAPVVMDTVFNFLFLNENSVHVKIYISETF